jgi:DNA-binding CsgD family transcriptional regulator
METPKLTEKQLRVAQLASRGLSNAQIAERLGSTIGGIEQHLVNIFRILGITTRGDIKAKLEEVGRESDRAGSAG